MTPPHSVAAPPTASMRPGPSPTPFSTRGTCSTRTERPRGRIRPASSGVCSPHVGSVRPRAPNGGPRAPNASPSRGPALFSRYASVACRRSVAGVNGEADFAGPPTDASFEPVDALDVDGVVHMGWDEAVEQVVEVPAWPLHLLEGSPMLSRSPLPRRRVRTDPRQARHRGGSLRTDACADHRHCVALTRRDPIPDLPFVKMGVTVENTTPWSGGGLHRDDAMAQSLIAVHTMLAIDEGRFVSLLDPPDDAGRRDLHLSQRGVLPGAHR